MGLNRWRVGRIVPMVFALVVSACVFGNSESQSDSSTTVFVPKPVINIVINDWTASAINVAIAEQLIERELSYPVVPVRLDDTTEMYAELAEGEVDAVLEVWPSTLTERDKVFFARGEVMEYGALGPIGKVGWFVPSYVIEGNPALVSWEGFADIANARLFATSSTAPNGRLLGTDINYRQYDKALVASLSLPLVVEFSGSEQATLAEVEARAAAQDPVLFWWWTPTAAVGAFDLVNVELPPATDECVAAMESVDQFLEVVPPAPDGFACGYPEDVIFKAGNSGLVDKAPEVDRFIREFTLTSEDQIQMLEAVEYRGKTIDDVARGWIEANEHVWRSWVEAPQADEGS